MKEKIKNILFGSFISYVIVIVALMLFSYFTSVSSISLSDSEENLEKIKQYKEEVNKLDNNNCVTVIDEMIEYYEDTSYDGLVNLKEMFEIAVDGKSYLSFYADIRDNCDLTNDVMNEMGYPTKIVPVAVNIDQLIQNYYYQYELSLKDMVSRQIMGFDLNNLEYQIRKKNELELIDSLIKLEKERNDIDE
jgi:hypothetical protein